MVFDLFIAYEPGEIQKLPKMKKTRNFHFFSMGKLRLK